MQTQDQEIRMRGKSKRQEYVPELDTVRILGVKMRTDTQRRDGIVSQTRRICLAVVKK